MLIAENYRTVRRQSSKLLNFNNIEKKQRERGKTYGCAKFLNGIFNDASQISTVHGSRMIFNKSTKGFERSLFLGAFIFAIFLLAVITFNIYYIYRYEPLSTCISDLAYPVYKIPFPEIAICNRNRLNWQRYNEAKIKFLKREHRTPVYEDLFKEVVNAYDTLRFGRFNNFENLYHNHAPHLLKQLNYVNLTQVVELMAWKCDEIFSNCSWQNRTLDCCDIFSRRRSQKGQCLSFNTIESEEGARKQKLDRFYPWHGIGGPRSGLNVRIHIREGWHSPLSEAHHKGILIMMVEPSVWAYIHHDIPTNTRVYASIRAFLHVHDENTRRYSAEVRNCMFRDERDSVYFKSLAGRDYMYENCQSQCEQEYLVKFCNCTVDMFFPPGQRYRACRLTDLPCLYHHNVYTDRLQYFPQIGELDYVESSDNELGCPCLFNCRSLHYYMDFRIEHLSLDNINSNDTGIDLSVFYQRNSIMVYETSAIYPIENLMASVGGLAGLFIGLSLVGVTEVLYFGLFDFIKQGLRYIRFPWRFSTKRDKPKVKRILVRRSLEG
ncbi:pickpocket protein 19-like [Stomoxys calcitrans]|uniref:pickpocket protein 19-like n=1 Tax=Stomoxys calcitrans TaxID=35570 RepID=UPI0027E2DBCB|nr:pickpocket protein 19-like [Stomoxys calcitrans]